MIGRALVIWLLIAGLEVLQGILRVRFLNRPLGDHRARQVGVLIGSMVVLGIAWLFGPWIRAVSVTERIEVGVLWFTLMLAFDLVFGRLVFRFSWRRIGRDFDVRRGGLLGLGMLVVLLAPLLVTWLGR